MEEDEGRRMSSVYEMVINEKQNVSKPWMKAGSFHEEVLKKESETSVGDDIHAETLLKYGEEDKERQVDAFRIREILW
jgi:hypothetical protein